MSATSAVGIRDGLQRVAPLTVPASTLATLLALLSGLVTAVVSAAAIPGGLSTVTQGLLPFLGSTRKHPSPWGRVVNAATGMPLQGAVVTVLDPAGKPRESARTKEDGAFGLLLPPGTYGLTVAKEGWTLAHSAPAVPLFPGEQLFVSGTFRVTAEETVVPLVVPLQAPAGTPVSGSLRPLLQRLTLLHARIALPLLFVGVVLTTFALLLRPTPLLVVYALLYSVLLLLELSVHQVARRTLGRVRDAVLRLPVALALVRLVEPRTHRILATRATSPKGQFLLMPPPGTYTLQATHAAYRQATLDHLAVGRGAKGTVRADVGLEPK